MHHCYHLFCIFAALNCNMMKYLKIVFAALAFLLMSGSAFAQKNVKSGATVVNATILNNSFNHVDLINAYGNERKTYASADVVGDKFSMNLELTDDIYRFDFGGEKYFLIVLKKNETINITIDAENLQRVPEVSGSNSMSFVQEATNYTFRRKTVLDSLNNALQSDPRQTYWSRVAQNINLFKQTNDDVDRYILSAYDNVDSLSALCKKLAPNAKIKGGDLDVFVTTANKCLKDLDNNYRPFANYLENVDKYYDFSTGRLSGYSDFYMTLDQYIQDVNARHEVAENSLGKCIGKAKKLIADRDSLVYNNLMDQKKNKSAWADAVVAFVRDYAQNMVSKHADYNQQVAANNGVAPSLVSGSQEIVKNIVNGYQTQYNETDSYVNNRILDLIKANKNDISVLMFLDMFPKEQNAALHQDVITALHNTYAEHPIVKERWNMMNSPAGKTSIGAIAPELAFKDPDGNTRKLSDLRGKVVLIDFWASWCGPCRRESPNVRNVYSKYHDKGFEVFSVSLDKDYNNWVKAIKDDQLVWPNHVSDLKYWSSEAAAIYGVRSIPAMFLLDREGRIVAKDLRGEALERAVKQLLGE